MTPAWAQRREEVLSDCLVSPDVFHQMLDRLGEFVVPYRTHSREHVIRPGTLYGLFLQGFAYSFVSDNFPGVPRTGSSDGKTEAKTDISREFSRENENCVKLVGGAKKSQQLTNE